MRLEEITLSRFLRHIDDHDAAIVSGWRDALDCGRGPRLTRAEKQRRNAEIRAIARGAGYHVADVGGGWVEIRQKGDEKTEVPVDERAVFIFDADDIGGLRRFAMELGRRYEQDAIIFIPAGTRQAELIRTNTCPGNWAEDAYGLKRPGDTHVFTRLALGRILKDAYTRLRGRTALVFHDPGQEDELRPMPPSKQEREQMRRRRQKWRRGAE